MTTRRTVEILGGNETIRRIMATSLRGIGLDVVEREEGDEAPALSDLLVADVDSGIAVSDRAAKYTEDDRLVVLCGLRDSRERHLDRRWVDRPFTPAAFVNVCADALGVPSDEPEPDFDSTATAALKPPPSVARKSDEPITRELDYDEAQDLEKRLGLDPGVLAAPLDITVSDEEAFEVLDIDDSAILAVDHLKFALGGKLRGQIETRRVEKEEIAALREEEIQVRGVRSPTFNQTMPDTPHAIHDSENDEAVQERDRRVTSNVGAAPRSERGPDTGAGSDQSAIQDRELRAQIHGVARMLAESWQRIALTSRTEDRADRIERVLVAAVAKGLAGAAEEVQRIPAASGFAGALNSLTFVEVVRTVRDRRLRGRLEVAIGEEAFVVHMDGLYLEEIDTLSGNVDGMLLDILHQGGALDDRTYNELVGAWEGGQLSGPIELALARKKVVADATLQSARVVRAREIFRRLCRSRGGQFAFLEIRSGDGQPWPVDPLRVNVDQLMLELLRESSIDTGDSQATASTRLQLDPNRAASLEPGRLTEEERNVMMFFRDGDTLEAARDRLQKQAGPEDVDRIVDRLKKVELLKRSDPSIAIPRRVEDAARNPPSRVEGREAPTPPTTVAPVDDIVAGDIRLQEVEDAMDTDQTASIKANWDIIPDTSELDELIEESIAAYESEASEVQNDDEDEEPS